METSNNVQTWADYRYPDNFGDLADSVFGPWGYGGECEFATPQLKKAANDVKDWEDASGKYVPLAVAREFAVKAGVEEAMIPAFIAFIWSR